MRFVFVLVLLCSTLCPFVDVQSSESGLLDLYYLLDVMLLLLSFVSFLRCHVLICGV